MGKPVRRCFQYKDLREQTYVFAKISVRAGAVGNFVWRPAPAPAGRGDFPRRRRQLPAAQFGVELRGVTCTTFLSCKRRRGIDDSAIRVAGSICPFA